MGWKDPPADTTKTWLNRSLEIQLLLRCNWSCIACDQLSQFSSIAWVKKGTMTLSQIEFFCDEMIQSNSYFGRCRLVGGEPTIHPKFAEIVALLHRLVVAGHIGCIEVVTNGSHPERIAPVRHLLAKVRVSDDNDKQKHHTANLIHTPQSLGYEGKRCNQPEHCGWSLSYYGYAPCSSAAGIMRLRDLMEHSRLELPLVGRTVRDSGTDGNWPRLQDLCNLCYHALKPEHKIKSGTSDPQRNLPGPDVKPQLDAWLAGRKPSWPVYGAKGDMGLEAGVLPLGEAGIVG